MDRSEIEDLFAPFARVTTRRMFSGYGVYIDDACFALALMGSYWLKADEEMCAALEAAGATPFSYAHKNGKEVIVRSFWTLPEAALDDEDELKRWCAPALEAARRTAAEKARKAQRRREKLSSEA